jgi:hypothetical protein
MAREMLYLKLISWKGSHEAFFSHFNPSFTFGFADGLR